LFPLKYPWVHEEVKARQANPEEVVRDINARSLSKNDLIVVFGWEWGIPFHRYYQGPNSWMTVPPIEDHRFHRYDLVKEKMLEKEPLQPLLDKAAQTLKDGNKVFVVVSRLDFFQLPKSDIPPDILPPPNVVTGWNHQY